MPIESDKASVGELRRGAQLAGAERGRRASDAGEVGFDGIKTVGQRQGSGETRALDAEPGSAATPAPRSAASRWEAAANPWLGAIARCSRTGSSNPSPSRRESANFQFLDGAAAGRSGRSSR
jgi:hypothetical protein